MSTLESRYRWILMLLPAVYRERRGEEMLGTLLDTAASGQRWPRTGEVASLAALAVRLRVGAPGGTRRSAVYGEVLRRIALAGLFAEAFWYGAWGASAVVVGASSRYGYAANWTRTNKDWLVAQAVTVGLPCVLFVAYLALVFGRRRLGRALGVLQGAVVTVVVGMDGAAMTDSDRATVMGVAALVAVATLLGFHRQAPRIERPGRWLGVIAAGLVVCMTTAGATTYTNLYTSGSNHLAADAFRLLFGPLTPAVAVGFAVLRARRSPVWPATLLALGLPGLFLVPRTVGLLSQGNGGNLFSRDLFSGGLWPGESADVMVTVTVLALALWWALHRQRARSAAALGATTDVP